MNPEPVLVVVTDQQYPARGLRDLAAKLALDKGRHVHYVEGGQVFCLENHCIYLEEK